MRRLLDRIYRAAGGIAACFVALIALLMLGQSVLREFGVGTGAVPDVVAWCCAAAGFFAMAHAFKHGDFVRVTLLLESVPPRVRQALEIASLLIGTVAVSYLAWAAVAFTHESWEFQDMSTGLLAMPLWIPQLGFAAGAVLLWVAVVDELVIVLSGGRPSFVVAVEQRHAQGDFSSDI
ncbi:TRAP transporter small permease [Aquincola sp. MAHUQ-54]|uniref:TRAP transporter small permease protein n=1 Tax=Aquincola agrisoli TaxID=3119538 RepID=A0AAW9Q9Y5_9BURK